MVEITVSQTIEAPIQNVYEVLIDIQSYPYWWELPIKYKGSQEGYFQFSPLPGIHIGLEKIFHVNQKLLQFKYVKGPFRGTGNWNVQQKSENLTWISYSIELEPTNYLFNLISSTNLFKTKHTNDIKKLIRTIEKRAAPKSK